MEQQLADGFLVSWDDTASQTETDPLPTLHNECWHLFHTLWGESKEGIYIKKNWIALQLELEKLGI